MKKYLFLMTITVLSFSFIVITPSCSDEDPEVLVGDKGDKGDKGDTGERGPSGTTGAKGDAGDRGPSGATGPKGDTGAKGDRGNPGNANVKKYTFDVSASQWLGAHFGANNSHNYFRVEPSLTGNINMNSYNYVTLMYAKPADVYRETKQLPFRFNVNDNYVILLEFSPARGEIFMSKSTDGIKTLTLPLAERPSIISFTVIMIEVGAVNALKGKLDFDNIHEVSNYFELN